MFACINPWVRNSASILRIKALRFTKLPDKIGWVLFRSARTSPTRLMHAKNSTIRNGVDVQPKFCPKEGTHSKRLKKIKIRTAPDTSKFFSGFFTES